MTELVPLEDIIDRLQVIGLELDFHRETLGITSVHEERNFRTVHALLDCIVRILEWMA